MTVLFSYSYVSSVTLISPENNTWSNQVNYEQEFSFEYSDAALPDSLVYCTLEIDSQGTSCNTTLTSSSSPTVLTANSSCPLRNGTRPWNVRCGGNVRSVTWRTINIDTVVPITSNDAPTGWSNTDVTVTFTANDDGLSPTTVYSCLAEAYEPCVPVPLSTITVTEEGVNNLQYYSSDDAENKEDERTLTVSIDKTKPSISVSEPDDDLLSINKNTFNFTFIPVDAYSTVLNCSLVLNNVVNETNATTDNGTATTFQNLFLPDNIYDWHILCIDQAGNWNVSETRTLTIDVEADKPILSPIPLVTNQTSMNIYGYVNRSATNVSVYAVDDNDNIHESWQITNYLSNKTGTAVVNKTLPINSSYVLIFPDINGELPSGLEAGNFIEFANHYPPYMLRYEIITAQEEGDWFRLNITPNLRMGITKGEAVSSFDGAEPTGWFNISVQLWQGNNTIKAKGKRLGTVGPVSDTLFTFSDLVGPTFNLSQIINYSTNTPTLQFIVEDDYQVNVSTIEVILANVSGSLNFNISNMSCSGTPKLQNCQLTTSRNDGSHSINVSASDTSGHYGISTTVDFLVNSQAPTVNLTSPDDGYVESSTNDMTLSFFAIDIVSPTLNCSLYLNGQLNQTNHSVLNGTVTSFAINDLEDGTYTWKVYCKNTVGLSTFSEQRTFYLSNTPSKPVIWSYPDVTKNSSIAYIGYVNRPDSFINVTAVVGELVPEYFTDTTSFVSTLYLNATTLRQSVSTGLFCIYVNKSYNNSFTPGRWIQFGNHDKEDSFFEGYEIYNRSNYFEGGENQFYTKICLDDNLTSDVPVGTALRVYSGRFPTGWLNISVDLREGQNNITSQARRFGYWSLVSDVTHIFYDIQNPVFNLTQIPGNVTTHTPLLNFSITDNYYIDLSTLLLNISNSTNSKMHVWTGGTVYNITNWTMGESITCSGATTRFKSCFLTPSLNDGIYNLSFQVNDSVDNQGTAIRELIVAADVETPGFIYDSGATTDNRTVLSANWDNTTDDIYFSHYELALGTAIYPSAGYNNTLNWFPVGSNITYLIEDLNLTHGQMYYIHLKAVNLFGAESDVISTDGIAIEDNSVPIYHPGSARWIGTDQSNAWTNEVSILRGLWNFTDNETGISKYKFMIGTSPYPLQGYNSILSEKETLLAGFNETTFLLQDNISYYFSVKAKNGYQYGNGWTDWYSSDIIKRDTVAPINGLITYNTGNYTTGSIILSYITGTDTLSGYDYAQLLLKESLYDPINGGCNAYDDYTIINASITQTVTLTDYQYMNLTDGRCYKFALRVYDKAGNVVVYTLGNEEYNVTSDSTPPSQVIITDGGVITGSRDLTFSWTSATDPHTGIGHYEYALGTSLGGEQIISFTNNGLNQSIYLQDLPLQDETTYYLTVRAYNRVGLSSNSYSDGILYLDMEIPAALTLISISDDTNATDGFFDYDEDTNTTIKLTGENGLTCAWSWYDIDYTQPALLTNYSWACTNTANNPATRSGNYTCEISPVPEGVYYVYVGCKDDAGNKQLSTMNTDIIFTKESEAPQITFNEPDNNSIVNLNVTFNATVWDVSSYVATYQLISTLNDSVVANGTPLNTEDIVIDTTNLEGEFEFRLSVTDSYNRSSNGSIFVIVDNSAPTLNIILPGTHFKDNFNFTIKGTLLQNLSLVIRNASAQMMFNQSNTSTSMRNTLTWIVPLNVTGWAEGTYTITAIAKDNESNNRTDVDSFVIDRTHPVYLGIEEITPADPKYEDQTVTIYRIWRDLGMDTVWVTHNANGSFVNYTATATTPGIQIFENATRYMIEIPAYLLEPNELVNYTWHAIDLAGNENSTTSNTFQIVNRVPVITTTSISDGFVNYPYQEIIYFYDNDSSHVSGDFNCTVSDLPMNATIAGTTMCVISFTPATAGTFPINVTINDGISSVYESYNLTIEESIVNNITVDSSHTVQVYYYHGGQLVRATSSPGTGTLNTLIPVREGYTIRFESDDLIVEASNVSSNDSSDFFLRKINPSYIEYDNDSLGTNNTYEPEAGYAVIIDITEPTSSISVTQLWNNSLGGVVYSSPTISDEILYVGSSSQNLSALNISDGAIIWNFPTGGAVESKPLVSNGVVYFGSADNNVYALNATDGSQVWNYTTNDGISSSATSSGETLYIGSNDGTLYALNMTDGSSIWNYSRSGYIGYSSPYYSSGIVYFGDYNSTVHAVNTTDGSQVWNYTTGGYIDSSPVVTNGILYLGSTDNLVYALNVTDGSQVWNYTTGGDVVSSPYVDSATVYIGSFDNNIYALDALTGTQDWNYSTGASIRSSPYVSAGKVYFGSNDDYIYGLNASTGTEIWNFQTRDNVESSPYIDANGFVYIGSNDNNTYALHYNDTIQETIYNFDVGFDYPNLGFNSSSNLEIFKYEYNSTDGNIIYIGGLVNSTVTSEWIYTSVSEFSVFVLAENTSYVAPSTPYCGDGTCSNGEICSSCSVDCGVCGGSSGGGSGGSSNFASLWPILGVTGTCHDNEINQGEIGVDCGGPCNPCITCHDRIQNQNETGVDCGGPCHPCKAPTCTDGRLNGDEIEVDCGGVCKPCYPIVPTCDDGLFNGNEEGVDCGGSCIPCPGCDNGMLDEGEEGLDCGGVCSEACVVQIVEKPVEIKKIPGFIWLIVIGIGLIGGLAALWVYNQENKKVVEEKQAMVVEQQQMDELKEEDKNLLKRYIFNYLSRGLSPQNITSQLVLDGFNQQHIDSVVALVMKEQMIEEVQNYVKNYSKQGYTISELKDWMKKNGIEEGILDEALRNMQNVKDFK